MKKLIFALICFICSVFSSAQSDHLTFKGIPIDGKLSSYVAKLKTKGLIPISIEKDLVVLKGEFAGYKNCKIAAVSSKNKDVVDRTVVFFPSLLKWSLLENNYLSLKNMLSKKYGDPSTCVEEFQSNSTPTDDGMKMTELILDQCKYYSVFTTEKGNIELSIEKGEYSEGFVKLLYLDKINGEIIQNAVMDDL